MFFVLEGFWELCAVELCGIGKHFFRSKRQITLAAEPAEGKELLRTNSKWWPEISLWFEALFFKVWKTYHPKCQMGNICSHIDIHPCTPRGLVQIAHRVHPGKSLQLNSSVRVRWVLLHGSVLRSFEGGFLCNIWVKKRLPSITHKSASLWGCALTDDRFELAMYLSTISHIMMM